MYKQLPNEFLFFLQFLCHKEDAGFNYIFHTNDPIFNTERPLDMLLYLRDCGFIRFVRQPNIDVELPDNESSVVITPKGRAACEQYQHDMKNERFEIHNSQIIIVLTIISIIISIIVPIIISII